MSDSLPYVLDNLPPADASDREDQAHPRPAFLETAPMEEETKEAPPAWWQDLNGNGVADYKEPIFYKALWFGVRMLAGFLPQHTLFVHGVKVAEEFRTRAEAELAK